METKDGLLTDIRVNKLLGAYNHERDFEYEKWACKIPFLKFPSDWEIKIIPPFGAAIARFWVNCGKAEVSVYLDCYDTLGCMGQPYWEVYPAANGDTERFFIDNTKDLLKSIAKSIAKQNKSTLKKKVI